MAQSTSAMTPEDALQTIAGVRAYREGLTARAAGLVWMVWGLAFGLMAFAALFVELPQQYGDVTDGVPGLKSASSLFTLVTLLAAALATNAVWKAFALRADARHRSWVAYVAALAVVFSLLALGTWSNSWARANGTQIGPYGLNFAPVALTSGAGAFTIALLQRRRVSVIPGTIAGCALVAVFAVARFTPWDQGYATQFWGSAALAFLSVAAYFATALWTTRHG